MSSLQQDDVIVDMTPEELKKIDDIVRNIEKRAAAARIALKNQDQMPDGEPQLESPNGSQERMPDESKEANDLEKSKEFIKQSLRKQYLLM